MAADKRTLVIALIAMFSLVLVGVVSAAVFTTSACAALDPDPVSDRIAGTDVDAALDGAFGGDEATRVAAVSAIDTLTGLLGPVTGVADVSGADALVVGAAGPVATGPVTTALGPGGSDVIATAQVDGHVVGDGDVLYGLSIGNELTGQVDALLPLDGQLDAQTCVDALTVGTPLAFQQDAGGGELLLLRVDEDGGDPEVELRDHVEGRRWAHPVELTVAPAGVLGQRTTGKLGPDAVVVGHRTTPDAEAPALSAFDRADGTPRWSLDRDAFGDALAADAVADVEVLAVDTELVVAAVVPGDASAEGADDEVVDDGGPTDGSTVSTVVAFAADTGSLVWEVDMEPGTMVLDMALDDGRAFATVRGPAGVGTLVVESEGVSMLAAIGDATDGRTAVRDGDLLVTTTDTGVLVHHGAETTTLSSDVRGLDAVVDDDGAFIVLLGDAAREGAVAVTFEAAR